MGSVSFSWDVVEIINEGARWRGREAPAVRLRPGLFPMPLFDVRVLVAQPISGAVQFDGSYLCARALADMPGLQGVERWEDGVLMVRTVDEIAEARRGDWIVCEMHGHWEVVDDQTFRALYKSRDGEGGDWRCPVVH